MGVFDRLFTRRPPKKSASRKKRLPERHLAPVEEIVEQGMMVADVATRMTVKNAIILNALGNRADYDQQQIIEMVRETVLGLANERGGDAKHISRMRGEISAHGSSQWTKNSFGQDDSKTLRHRQEVYEQVAAQLMQRAEDDEYLTQTAERARSAAWQEIGDSISQKATHPYYSGGSSAEYQRERDERIQLLIQRDLTQLVSDHAHSQRSSGKLLKKVQRRSRDNS